MITAFFFGVVLFKNLFRKEICAICAAVSLTWVGMLVLYLLDLFSDQVLVALLMGQTVLAIYYLMEKKVVEKLTLFRLPFLLTLIAGAYSLLSLPEDIFVVIVLLLGMWVLFFLFYLSRNNQRMQSFTQKIIECCKKW